MSLNIFDDIRLINLAYQARTIDLFQFNDIMAFVTLSFVDGKEIFQRTEDYQVHWICIYILVEDYSFGDIDEVVLWHFQVSNCHVSMHWCRFLLAE